MRIISALLGEWLIALRSLSNVQSGNTEFLCLCLTVVREIDIFIQSECAVEVIEHSHISERILILVLLAVSTCCLVLSADGGENSEFLGSHSFGEEGLLQVELYESMGSL